MTPSDAFEARFAALKARFRERLRLRLRNLRTLQGEADALPELKAVAHDLAGSSGTFGFPSIGERAFALEAAVERGDREAAGEALAALVAEIEAELGDV